MRKWLIISISYAILIFALSSISNPPQTGIEHSDKTAHFLLYFGFGVALYFASMELKNYDIKYSLIVGSLYGITDEIHQYFVPNRSFDIGDIIIDVIGVFLGIIFIWYLYIRRKGIEI